MVEIENVTQKLANLEAAQSKLECLSDYEMEEELAEASDVKGQEARSVLAALETKCKEQTPGTSSVASQPSSRKVKLPTLDLRKFDGNILEFYEWWDMFEVLVHRQDFQETEKFAFLELALEGEAKTAISQIKRRAENYEVAIAVLKSRFGKPGEVREAVFQNLVELQPVGEDVAALRDFVDTVEINVRALQNLNVKSSEYGPWFLCSLEKKLPPEWRRQWARLTCGKEESFDGFMEFLKSEMDIKLRSSREARSHETERLNEPAKSSQLHRPATTQHLMHRVKEPVGQKDTSCVFCKSSDHRPRDCTRELTVEKRREMVKEAKACFTCGYRNHHRMQCKWKGRCKHCGGRHIHLLCSEREHSTNVGQNSSVHSQKGKKDKPTESSSAVLERSGLTQISGHSSIMLRTGATWVNKRVVTRFLLDNGASRSFIRSDVAAACGAVIIGRTKACVEFYRNGRITEEFDVVRVSLSSRWADLSLEIEALVDDDPAGMFSRLPRKVADFIVHAQFRPLSDVVGEDECPVGIIVGEDFYDRVVTGQTRYVQENLKVTPSLFGWIVHGETPMSLGGAVGLQRERNFKLRVIDPFEKFWELEHLGIIEEEDSRPREIIESQLKRGKDGRWCAGWPWKDPEMRPDVNFGLAEKRLKRVESSLDEEHWNRYTEAVNEMIDSGFAERVDETCSSSERVSYLPHRPVFKDSSTTTKTRVVFDASARKTNGLSLNDCLHPGPSLLPSTFELLCKFRLKRVAVAGDLKKAYLQIVLNEEDRDFCRFLWDQKVFRMTRVLFGVTSSPAILQLTILKYLSEVDDPVAEILRASLYVDDTISSHFDEERALSFWSTAVGLFREAHFELGKLRSSGLVLEKALGLEPSGENKVLGMEWDCVEDTLSVECVEMKEKVTKRTLASFLAKVHDPLGLISPALTAIKILLQDLWRESKDWDETLSPAIQERARVLMLEVGEAASIRIPRWTGWTGEEDLELHIFCDASGRTYAACVYLKIKSVGVTLIASKARLVPVKWLDQFSPKLELLGCFIGAKLGRTVHMALGLTCAIWFWTDSMICLAWIRQKQPHTDRFVRNRVATIREWEGKWSFVPTQDNPADIPTREATGLVKNALWWSGPRWLQAGEEEWPVQPKGMVEEHVGVARVRHEPAEWIQELVEPQVSKWRILVRAVARILNARTKFKEDISLAQEKGAEMLIFQQVQRATFPDGVNEKRLQSLLPFAEKGLIRMGGRLQLSALAEEEKHPVLLQRCGAVDLFVIEVHTQLLHAGPPIVLVEMRKRGVWLLRGKKAVSCVLRLCLVCRRFSAKRCVEKTPPLPNPRVRLSHPFDVVGVDLGGPLVVLTGEKIWFALFTCFQVRAIHLEIVSGLSEMDMMRAMLRFVSRRGVPSEIWSDHGTNFVAIARQVREQGLPITWRFIVERGPWWGGIWEKLIGLTKNLMKREFGKRLMSREDVETKVIQIESVLNRRPISYLWEGGFDSPQPLCPEDFLLMKHLSPFVEGEQDFRDMMHRRDEVIDVFRQRWTDEYLLCVLGSLGKVWNGEIRVPTVGSVVLLGEDHLKRQNWELGVVQELIKAPDGGIRAAKIAVSRKGVRTILTRPVRKLFLLECDNSESEPQIESDEESVGVDNCESSEPQIGSDEESVGVIETRRGRRVRRPARYDD